MEVAKIQVGGTCACAYEKKTIRAGMVGVTVSFAFDEYWDGLNKIAVYRCGGVVRDEYLEGDTGTIPAEVLTKSGFDLEIGVYGTDAEKQIAIPTCWANLGVVRPGADPSGDPAADPSLPIWAQILAKLGNLADLSTEAKENLVAAINEALTKGGGEVDPEEVGRIVNEYLEKNPPAAYILPIATETTLGGVKAAAATEEMTQPVGITAEGKLVTVPCQNSGGNVAYDEAQNLTDEQKAQARENIGAQPAGNYLTEVPEGYAKTEDVPTDEEIIQLIKDNAPESSSGGIAVTGAKVGQTVKISAVDENGVPTAWLPTDFPSGGSGGGKWELIAEGTVPEETGRIDINKDINGNDFELIAWYLFATLEPCKNNKTDGLHTRVNDNAVSNNASSSANNLRYYQSKGEMIGGYATICAHSISTLPYNHSFNVSNMTPAYTDYRSSNIKSISIYYGIKDGITANVAGANSKYVLYGVRV